MIRDAKKRIEELKLAIELFEKKKAAVSVGPGHNPRTKTLFRTLCKFLHLDRLEAAKETRS
jgi:hypothetical protein